MAGRTVMMWVIAAAVLLLLVLAGVIYLLLRLRMIAIIAAVEDTVDAMMDETFVHQQQMYQDTLSGRTHIKLKRLYEKMTMTAEQSQKQQQQTQTLISDISHQVKTPIANIKMLNETLNTQNLPVAKREQLNEQLTQQVDKLDTLVQGMVKASKLASGWVETDEDALRQFEQIKSTGATTVSVFGADQLASEAGPVYLVEFDAEKFQSGNYVVAFGIADNGEGSVHYEIGDEIEIAGQSYELMAMMDPRSTITDDNLQDSLISLDNKLEIEYMIPKKAFLKSFSDGRITGIYADVENEDQLGMIIERMSDAYPELRVESKDTYRLRFESQVLAQVVLGYTLGLIMAVVGILNFINSMLTAIITRKREFAMLESIGMTKKQIRQMLIHEGMSYSKWSLVISLILSTLVANTWVANSVSESWVAAYHFSLAPFILIIPLMLVLAYQIPMICSKRVQKKSLVERLRETA